MNTLITYTVMQLIFLKFVGRTRKTSKERNLWKISEKVTFDAQAVCLAVYQYVLMRIILNLMGF